MSYSIGSAFIGTAGGCLLLAYIVRKNRSSSSLPLPPSPRPYPLIGNALSMPTKSEHIGFIKIGEQLNSDIISLSMLGTVIIVLNSLNHATNLLENQSGLYSDRPYFPVITEPSLMDWGGFLSVMNYGDRWKQSRRLINRWLHKKAAEAFQPSQQREARLLLSGLLNEFDSLNSSEELEAEISRAISSTLLHSIYGLHAGDSSDKFRKKARKAIDAITFALLPSNFLANVIPALIYVPDWFPGTRWKRVAQEWRGYIHDAISGPFEWTKAEMKKSAHEPSIVESMLEYTRDSGIGSTEAEEIVKHTAFGVFGAALDIVLNDILWFFVAMILHPEAQKKAKDEIDHVIGSDNLPEMKDRDRLPYIDRLIQEVHRWRPVDPIGVPHACQSNDVYQGYRIPKGAIIIANIWSMSRDPKVYPDPETFDPDRFLDDTVPAVPLFGFGRRVCPGRHYAEATLFIFIASILATFDIKAGQDEQGNDLLPAPEGGNNLVYAPLPFKLKLSPRSAGREQVLFNEE